MKIIRKWIPIVLLVYGFNLICSFFSPSYASSERSKNKVPRLVFCIGSPRGGTTLLASLLSGGEAYPLFPECSFITTLLKFYHDIVNYSDKERFNFYANSKENLAKMLRYPVYSMINNLIITVPFKREYLVLKDPELTSYADYIKFIVDTPFKIVGVVRDPRDVISSIVEVKRKRGEEYCIQDICKYIFPFYYSIEKLIESTNENELLIVRYEDIVQKKKETFKALDNFLGYTVSRESYKEVSFNFNKEDATYSPLYNQSISSEAIGKHRKNLTENQIKEINQVFSSYMHKYGYQ